MQVRVTAEKFARACASFACVNKAFASRCLRGSKQYFKQLLSFQKRKSFVFASYSLSYQWLLETE